MLGKSLRGDYVFCRERGLIKAAGQDAPLSYKVQCVGGGAGGGGAGACLGSIRSGSRACMHPPRACRATRSHTPHHQVNEKDIVLVKQLGAGACATVCAWACCPSARP
jgi:hypothetical protein